MKTIYLWESSVGLKRFEYNNLSDIKEALEARNISIGEDVIIGRIVTNI